MSLSLKTISRALTLLMLILLLALPLTSCASEEPEPEATVPAYVSPYDWRNLELIEERFFYSKEGQPNSRTGIDVSEHQEWIDWPAVANDGIEFAYIRLGNRGYTEGAISLDEYYHTNIYEARAAGIEVGVYFFSQAITEDEAREEAEFVLTHLEGIDLDYPIVYDHEPISGHEGRTDNLSSAQLAQNASAFCSVIEAAGKEVMIYGNKEDIAKLGPEVTTSHKVWFAEYNALTPSGQFDFVIWQYSDKGDVDGVATPVDMNIHFLTP